MIKPHLGKKKKLKTMQDRIDRRDQSFFSLNARIVPCSKIAEEETTY